VSRASLPALAVLLFAAFTLTACGEREEPFGELAQPYPVTVQGAGEQPTLLREAPARIVALDQGSARLVGALGVGRRLVGVPTGVRASPGARPVVDRTGQVDVEAVVALRPDLLVASPSLDALDVARAQRESGAALYVQPAESVDDIVEASYDLGFLVGEPVRARRLATRIQNEVDAVEQRVAGVPVTTTFVDTGFRITISTRSLLGDLIRRARGESVAGAAPGPDPFPADRLRELDPEVYLATTDSRVTLGTLRKDPRTADLRAVREGRVVVLPPDVLTPGPRVGRTLEDLAQALHPDASR
jgi:ABC-type Fe3+-hydroxamate transport system substrate-binding protein